MARPINETPLEAVSYSMQDAARAVGVGTTYFCELVQAAKIPTFRLGRRRLVRKRDLQEFVDQQAEAGR